MILFNSKLLVHIVHNLKVFIDFRVMSSKHRVTHIIHKSEMLIASRALSSRFGQSQTNPSKHEIFC